MTMDSRSTVLLVHSDESALVHWRRVLADGREIMCATSLAQAKQQLKNADDHPKAIVCRGRVTDGDGMAFLANLHKRHPKIQCILIAKDGEEKSFRGAIGRDHIFRCLGEAGNDGELLRAVEYATLEYDILDTMESVEAAKKDLERQLNHWAHRSQRVVDFFNRFLRQTTLFLARLLVLLLAAVGIGVAVVTAGFFLLYIAKMVFGINIFAHAHLEDFVRLLFPDF
ncbi:MAG: hypothetical protein K9M45_13415 [Kiritimatiellales bacterium]|nr:hypothetical protein [Kiritimatiellales bacterium]